LDSYSLALSISQALHAPSSSPFSCLISLVSLEAVDVSTIEIWLSAYDSMTVAVSITTVMED
jgi:hypothetical protein